MPTSGQRDDLDARRNDSDAGGRDPDAPDLDRLGASDGPSPATLCVWGGEEQRAFWAGATQVPVVHSVSFGYHDLDLSSFCQSSLIGRSTDAYTVAWSRITPAAISRIETVTTEHSIGPN
jgi:hypothetical protein